MFRAGDGLLLHRDLGARRHPADAGTEDRFDARSRAIQLGIAAGMLSRRTMPLSALGIFVLFAIAIWNYGIFHLADYPVFLGVAVYLALIGTAARLLRHRGRSMWCAGPPASP